MFCPIRANAEVIERHRNGLGVRVRMGRTAPLDGVSAIVILQVLSR